MEIRNSENSPIRVDVIPGTDLGLPENSGTLGMTLAPGVKDFNWNRDMRTDMRRLRDHWGADVLVSLIEEFEYERYEMDAYAKEAQEAGIAVEEFPIVDVNVPREEQVEEYADLVDKIVGFLRDGRNTVVHCRAGIGRTGTVVSSILVGLGHDPEDAMRLASEVRGIEVPQTEEQRKYVREFAKRYGGRWSG